MEALYFNQCCGEQCPFANDCTDEANRVGYSAMTTQISAPELIGSLLALNMSGELPGCEQKASVHRRSPSASPQPTFQV